MTTDTDYISSWKSKALSAESIIPPTTSDNSLTPHPETRRCGDVVTTFLCTSQWLHRYVSNETPNNVSREHRQNVSVVRLHKSYWYVVMTSHEDVMTTFHQFVSSTSQTSLKWNTQWRLSGTSPRSLRSRYLLRPISTSLRRLLLLPNETHNNVAVVRFPQVSELRCREALSLVPSLLRSLFQITLSWPPSGRFSSLI